VAYYKNQLVDGKSLAEQATALFWQLCERQSQALFDHCEIGEENRKARQQSRKTFAANLWQAFDQQCPNYTVRQLDAWAANRPKLSRYLQQEAP
jgi:CRISPR system Cascade subunit CasA